MAKTKKNRKSAVDVIKKVSKKQTSKNPFEVHVNKAKFKVLGQKSKNDVGLPGVSRSKAIQKRKVTLLQEYKFQDKTNKFFDRRIGEHNKNMTKEDKIMARFTAEKMKAHTKSSLFNLDDDVVLTHGGRTLEEIEQFEDPRSDEEDDDDGRNMKGTLDPEFVKEAHFGGGMLSVAAQDGELSRKDLISQLIADSKKRKAEKQQLKESTMKLTEQLDSEWKDLMPLLNPVRQTTKAPPGQANSEKTESQRPSPALIPSKPAVDKSSFDYLVKELRFESTGKPSDKLKSEDEIVRQDKEKLERLERERLKRMTLHDGDSTKSISRVYKSADDLDDGFAHVDINEADDDQSETSDRNDVKSDGESDDDEDGEMEEQDSETTLKSDKGVKRALDDENDENNENESVEVVEEESDDDDSFDDLVDNDDDSDDDNNDRDEEEVEKASDKTVEKTKVDSGKTTKGETKDKGHDIKDRTDLGTETGQEQTSKSSNKKIIRFAVDNDQANENQEEMKVGRVDETEKKGILKNARNQNEDVEMKAIESQETKELEEELEKVDLPFTFQVPKEYEELMELFDGRTMRDVRTILDRMIKVNHWSLGGDNKAKLNQLFAFLLQYLDDSVDPQEPKKCWQLLNTISPVLFELCLMDPDTSGGYLRSVIQEKYEAYSERDTRYPSVHSLIFLKLVSTLFPTSDARHYVTTPALIFLCHALAKSCPILTRDVAVGVFLATLCVEYIDLSKRYLPELVNYLQGILLLFCRSLPIPLTKPFKSACKHLLAFNPNELPVVQLPVQLRRKKTEESISKPNVKTSPSKKISSLDNQIDLKNDSSHCTDLTIAAADFYSNEKDIPVTLKVKVLSSVLKLVSLLMDKYASYDAAYLIFDNIGTVIRRVKEEWNMDVTIDKSEEIVRRTDNVRRKSIEDQIEIVVAKFDVMKNDRPFNYVAKEKEKPKILRLFEPEIKPVLKFHTKGAQKQREKLLSKYKKEMKGAIREIRKDGRFLQKVKLREQHRADEDRHRRVKEILGGCANQEGEIRNLKRKRK